MIVPAPQYARITEMEQRVFRRLQAFPDRELLDRGFFDLVLGKFDTATRVRLIELVEQSLDEHGHMDASRLTDEERDEVHALTQGIIR